MYGNGSHENTAATHQWPRRMSKITKRLFGREKTCVSKVQFKNRKAHFVEHEQEKLILEEKTNARE